MNIDDNDGHKYFVDKNKYKFCSTETNRFNDPVEQIFLTIE